MAYDYIVVGAGSAGCVLAGRLAEDPGVRVLVLEAGGRDSSPLVKVPLGVAKVWNGPWFNWSYQSEPEPHADGRSIFHPRGKVVGGSSSINMMAYVRGHRADYDRWQSLHGLEGWSFAHVLPYFKRAEAFEEGESPWRGGHGPLLVTRGRAADVVYDAFLGSAGHVGYAVNPDYNGADQWGFARVQFTARAGRRCSAAVAYLHPAVRRGNVDVLVNVHATRILMEGSRAVGVEYLAGGRKDQVRCEREVIVACGAINSPQLLMLSGIGPAEALRQAGIEPLIDLKGVGENLQDHAAVRVGFLRKLPSRIQQELRLDRLSLSMARAYCFGTGFAAEPPGGVTAFIRSSPREAIPDLQLFCVNASLFAREWFPGLRAPGPDGFAMRACGLRPESRGSIRLKSSDPAAPPAILTNMLSTDYDRRALREAIRHLRAIATSRAFEGLIAAETAPGPDVKSDADIDAYVRRTVDTVYHPVGTCRMGPDAASVVDLDFRVRGAAGLRVVDASVMPDLVGGNINAAVIMVAEKAADVICGRSALAPAVLPAAEANAA